MDGLWRAGSSITYPYLIIFACCHIRSTRMWRWFTVIQTSSRLVMNTWLWVKSPRTPGCERIPYMLLVGWMITYCAVFVWFVWRRLDFIWFHCVQHPHIWRFTVENGVDPVTNGQWLDRRSPPQNRDRSWVQQLGGSWLGLLTSVRVTTAQMVDI